MSHEVNTPGNPEHISHSNVKILIAAGKHSVDTEGAYANSRKRVEDLGIHFFKRGFNNILFLEDGFGTLNPLIPKINDAAKRHRSFRVAYWNIVKKFNEVDAKEITSLFDQNPMERFIRVGRTDGLTDDISYIQAFLYGIFVAMDGIVRKGYDLKLASEKSSNSRKQFLQIKGGTVSEWRELVQLIHETDIQLASQIGQLALQNSEKTRIMGIVGTAHAPICDNLPPSLKSFCQVVRLDPNDPLDIALLHDIQKGGISDEQITARLNTAALQHFNPNFKHKHTKSFTGFKRK